MSIVILMATMTVLTPSLADASTTSYNNFGLLNPTAISAHGRYVWVADEGSAGKGAKVVRVTASTGAHLAITSPLLPDPSYLISDGTYVWVVNRRHSATGASITRIDIATNKVTLVEKLPGVGFPVSLAIAGNYLWASGLTNDNALLRINRTTLSRTDVTSDLFIAGPVITADKRYVWVACSGGGPLGRASLARVSLATGAIKSVNSPYFNDPVTVTSTGTDVWMPASNHVVVKVDIATGEVSKVSSKSFVDSLWIASTHRFVYVLNLGGSTIGPYGALTRISEASNSLKVVESPSFTSPVGMAVLGSEVWVINSSYPNSGPTTKNLLVRVTF
jgi:hypothetical protein